MGKSTTNTRGKRSTDVMMRTVASSLVRDFQATFDDPSLYCDLYLALQGTDIAKIRQVVPDPLETDSIAVYKAKYQLQSVFKRYRFETDIYIDKELTQKAIDGFLETQSRIRELNLDSVDVITTDVLENARIYIANLLGVYDDEEHRLLCRFGRKASVGIPSRLACEAARWELPFPGLKDKLTGLIQR